MKIGDRVRVVGPDDSGFENLIGTEFEIMETWKCGDVTRISTMGVPWFPESSLERVVDEVAPSPNVTRHDYNRLISRIRALEKWQAEHDLEKSSRFLRTGQPIRVGEIRDFADTRPVHVEMADLAVLKVGDFRSLKAIRGLVQASVGPETTSDELTLLDRLIEAARAMEEDRSR